MNESRHPELYEDGIYHVTGIAAYDYPGDWTKPALSAESSYLGFPLLIHEHDVVVKSRDDEHTLATLPTVKSARLFVRNHRRVTRQRGTHHEG